MRQYYFAISRLSLGIIILQALVFIYFAANTEKINRRIEASIVALDSRPVPSSCLQPMYDSLLQEAYDFQLENARHNWIFWIIAGCGFVHLTCVYSLYIYFLRMGHSWTKLLLHLNNLSMATILPAGLGLVWCLGYIAGTRFVKHFCVVSSFQKEASQNNI